MIGQSIGNYKILKKLSQIKTVELYKAIDLLLNRSVLIKVLGRDFSSQPDIAEDFRFEAATLAKFSHRNIPTLHSLTDVNDSLFMILEFADGETLEQILRKSGKLTFQAAVPLFVQILECLEYTHRLGVAHNNLKTSNIVLSDAEAVKILGYGLGYGTCETYSAKQTAAIEIDASDDIFALGAMLFETLTGKSLVDFENNLELNEKLTEEIRKFLYSVNPFIPEEIKSAIIKAVLPNRIERFQTASAFREMLLAYSFDDVRLKEEISISEKLIADVPPFVGLPPFGAADDFDVSTGSLTAVPAETVSENKDVAVYSVNFSQKENKIRERKSNLNRIAPSERKVSPTEKSFLRKPQQKRFTVTGAGILAIIILHFAWQFSFIQSENLQNAEMSARSEQSERQIVEIEPEYEAKNRNFANPVSLPKIILPAEPLPEVKPLQTVSQPVLKKKTPLESRSERLRRVEKALTGI